MATFSDIRATFGLQGTGIPSKAGTGGTNQIGDGASTVRLTTATKIISFEAVIVGAASDLIIDISDLDNTGSTAWTAGSAQTETATAAGTTSQAGNVSVVVTSPGMTGTPKTIAVAVASGDTAAVWAGKVRTALAADTSIAEMWTVGGTTTAIVLTRKPTKTYTVNGVSVPLYAANIAANVALANGTPDPSITPAATSAEGAGAAAGVLTVGTYAPDLDGTDFEGTATGGLTEIHGIYIKNDSASDVAIVSQAAAFSGLNISEGNFAQFGGNAYVDDGDITIATLSDSAITVTIAGL